MCIRDRLKPGGTLGVVAVSYTHLDVYKRQAQAGRYAGCGRCLLYTSRCV
ncbi:hypothetical protein [Sphingobium sp. B2]|nr:hypothetical protein [Sphingobium sp. B2]